MPLTNVVFTPQAQPNNVVVPKNLDGTLKVGVLKISSMGSGVLGTAAAIGLTAGVVVSWSLMGNPGGTISLATKQDDPTQAVLSFNHVQIRPEPYLLIIQASTLTDGKVVRIPLAILVREPFSISEIAHPEGDFTLTGHTCDPTLPTLSFKGQGPGGASSDVFFIPPAAIPPGLVFSVDEDSTAYLTPAPSSLANPAGGIQGFSGATYTVKLKAYRAMTLYDTPENAAEVTVTYNLMAGAALGTPKFGLGASYDTVSKGVLLDAMLAFVGGRAPVGGYTTEWSVSAGAQGTFSPAAPDLSASWVPSTGAGVQDVAFTVTVKAAGSTIATATTELFHLTDEASWVSGGAAPVLLYPQKLYPQEDGKKVYFRVTTPDLATGETATVTFEIHPVGAAGAIADPPSTVTIEASSSTKDAVVGFSIPAGASVYDMWEVRVTADVAGGTQNRQGFAQLLAFSSGLPTLRIQMDDTSLSGSTGSHLTPVTLRAFHWAQKPLPSTPANDFLSPIASSINSNLVEVSGASYRVIGSPAGITPVFLVGGGGFQLTGLLTNSGTTTFSVMVCKTGYQSAVDSIVSATLVCTPVLARMSFSSFGSTNPVVAGSQGFVLSWGYSSTGTVTLQSNNVMPVVDVTGSQSLAISSISDSVAYILRGVNLLGEELSSPCVVQLGAVGSATKLPPSPAVISIDENSKCTVLWSPTSIGGSYVAYDYWKISLKDTPSMGAYFITKGVPPSSSITGLEPGFGGTVDARRFEFPVSSPGYHEISMQAFAATNIDSTLINSDPWGAFAVFPAPRTVTLDKYTASKGESITLTLGAAAAGTGSDGDRWQAVYSDGTSSEWFPMAITSVAKSFFEGNKGQTISVVVEANCTTAYPPVKLRRTVTKAIFIQDQEFQNPEGAEVFDVLSANVGVGGEAGFEVSSNLDGTGVSQPYLVVVPALVKDDTTNELKLLIATSRGRDASSILGTMALDVFPLAGRPHTLEALQTPGSFLHSDGVLVDPVSIVATQALPDIIVGQNIPPIQLQATGGVAPYCWFALDLPIGLSLSRDGRLTGTLQKLGRFAIVVSVQDSQEPSSISERTLSLTAKSDLAIVTTVLGNSQVGVFYSAQLEATLGIQPYTWDLVDGSIPEGITVGVDGLVSGWPVTYNSTTDFSTPYVFVLQAVDAVGAKASRQFTILLRSRALEILPSGQNLLIQGESFRLRYPVVGGKPPYTVVSSASGPVGLVGSTTMVNNVVEVVTLASFDTMNTDYSDNIGLRVRDNGGSEVYTEFTLRFGPSISVAHWATPSLETSVAGSSAPQTVSASGAGAGSSYTALEVIPPFVGVAVTSDIPKGKFTIAPPVSASRNQESTLRVSINQGTIPLGKVSREFSLLALQSAVTSSLTPVRNWDVYALPVACQTLFAFDPAAPGVNPATPAVWANTRFRILEGDVLPDGVSMHEASGLLYGAIPSVDGVPAISHLEAVNLNDEVVSTIAVHWNVVGIDIQIIGSLSPTFVGQVYNGVLSISGATSPVADLIHGYLPEGLTMAVVGDEIRITGRAMESGYYDWWIRVRDSKGLTGLYKSRLLVNYKQVLCIPTTDFPTIMQGYPYAFKLQAVGGATPYAWAVTSGALPTGITLSSDGNLSGTTATAASTFAVGFTVTDAYGQTATVSFPAAEIALPPPLLITTNVLPEGSVGVSYIGAQLQASGGV